VAPSVSRRLFFFAGELINWENGGLDCGVEKGMAGCLLAPISFISFICHLPSASSTANDAGLECLHLPWDLFLQHITRTEKGDERWAFQRLSPK
jgi:hypothetical protein